MFKLWKKPIPEELWEMICRPLNIGERLNVIRVFGLRVSDAEHHHFQLWNSIFEKETWLKTCLSQQHDACPVLLSPHLDRYYWRGASKKPTYMVLGVWDKSGDLKYEAKDFFDSLREHEFDESRYEVTFPSGIVLNVYDVIRSEEEIKVDPTRLFQGKRVKHLKTTYSVWNDRDCKLRTAGSSDYRGPYRGVRRQPILSRKNPDFFCMLTISSRDFAFSNAKAEARQAGSG